MKRTNRLIKHSLFIKHLLLALLLVIAGSLLPQPSAAQRPSARRKQSRVAPLPCPYVTPAPSPSPTPAPLPPAYLDAVRDAEVAEPSEISRKLIAVIPTESGLMWKGEGDERRVLVATWTNYLGYCGKQKGDSMPMQDKLPSVWVTTVPELKNFCARLPRTVRNRTLRLEQLLGMPPHKGYTMFVEMWLKPADLFRPSPDPEIVDHEAVLALTSKFLHVDDAYSAWFAKNKSTTYTGDPPYPWTRLGYTYDWGNRRSEVGLSEFGVAQNADAIIESVTPTHDYCRSARRRRR